MPKIRQTMRSDSRFEKLRCVTITVVTSGCGQSTLVRVPVSILPSYIERDIA